MDVATSLLVLLLHVTWKMPTVPSDASDATRIVAASVVVVVVVVVAAVALVLLWRRRGRLCSTA
jgi:hypothetical protein